MMKDSDIEFLSSLAQGFLCLSVSWFSDRKDQYNFSSGSSPCGAVPWASPPDA